MGCQVKIKIDKADQEFSLYIRRRDKKCVRCGSPGKPDKDGNPVVGLQNSHYFGRGKESTRFDPQNCDSLCFGCHQYWGSEDREAYRNFKIKQLGEEGYKRLVIRANSLVKKDRSFSLLKARELNRTLI